MPGFVSPAIIRAFLAAQSDSRDPRGLQRRAARDGSLLAVPSGALRRASQLFAAASRRADDLRRVDERSAANRRVSVPFLQLSAGSQCAEAGRSAIHRRALLHHAPRRAMALLALPVLLRRALRAPHLPPHRSHHPHRRTPRFRAASRALQRRSRAKRPLGQSAADVYAPMGRAGGRNCGIPPPIAGSRADREFVRVCDPETPRGAEYRGEFAACGVGGFILHGVSKTGRFWEWGSE